MYQWLYKFLIVTVCLSFFISATELDLGKSHNTFFDENDTYVKTEHVSFNLAVIERPAVDANLFIPNNSAYSHIFRQLGKTIAHQSTCDLSGDPPDLCVLNSTWRI